MSLPPPVRSFGVTDLLSDTWRVTVRIALPAAPLLLAIIATQFWINRELSSAAAAGHWWTIGITAIAYYPMSIVIYGALLRMALDGYDGTPSLGSGLRVALARFFPFLGLNLVFFIMVGLGNLFCLVPGIYLAVSLAAALPAVMDEKVGAIEALRNAWKRIDGHRWVFFAAGLVAVVGPLAVVFSGSLLVGLVASAITADGGEPGGWGTEIMMFADAYSAFTAPLWALPAYVILASLHRRIQACRGAASTAEAPTAPELAGSVALSP